MVRANYNTPENVPLYKASLAIWRTLGRELDFNIQFSTQGELDLCHTTDSLEVERDKSLLNRAYGVQTDVLTPEEVLRRCPLVDLTAGGELAGARRLLPSARLVRATRFGGVGLRLGRDAPGRAHPRADARHRRSTSSTACALGVRTAGGPVAAGAVVSAAAGWSSTVAAMAGLRLPIDTHPLQAFVTEPYAHVLDGLVSSMDLYIYVSQTARGELLVGAEILPYTTYSTRSTFGFLSEAAKRSIQILPFMADARAMRQWGGPVRHDARTPRPILGPVRGGSVLPDGRAWARGASRARRSSGGRWPS